MAVDVASKVTRLRERLRTSKEQSDTLKMRLQSGSAQPRYTHDGDRQAARNFDGGTRVSRKMLDKILAD